MTLKKTRVTNKMDSKGNNYLLITWWSTGTCCPERLWSVLLWSHSRPAWTRSCAACCRWPCFGRRVGLHDAQRFIPTPSILWFCDSVIIVESKTHRLEKTFKIIKSDHPPNTTIPTKRYPEVSHLLIFWTRSGMGTPPLPWAAYSNTSWHCSRQSKSELFWKITVPTFHRITESQNHRMAGVGRDLCGSPSSTPPPKKGNLQ